jgi:hypothetical protein
MQMRPASVDMSLPNLRHVAGIVPGRSFDITGDKHRATDFACK